MRDFCKQNFRGKPNFGGIYAAPGTLYSFYIFTAAIGGYSSKQGYGDRFADLIREQDLGPVWESQARVNSAFHADHSNKLWVWMPDVNKVKAWWETEKLRLPETKDDEAVENVDEDGDLYCGECGADLDEDGYCEDHCQDNYPEDDD